ncbi:MAG: family 20 glycosylhydrolase [Verrucomicrobiota bacterium]|jgi:alpha-L-fucosidase
MKHIIPTLLLSSLALVLAVSCRSNQARPVPAAPAGVATDAGIAIIPAPQKLERRAGVFQLVPATRIAADPASLPTAQWLAERLRRATGYPVPVAGSTKGKAAAGEVLLTTQGAAAALGPEGYALTVAPGSVVIRAPAPAGVFYGMQSFLELLPPEIFAPATVTNTAWQAPCVEIQDQPRFPWRGLMLDVSRHFYNKTEVEGLLDLLALHKINTFHWHLVDDQGWRIEIKKYPKLTQMGAWRDGVGFGLNSAVTTNYGPDGRYGGFYTQDDIREVVAYAQARHITIVPEIEMPGHSTAALSAYPQFTCKGGPLNIETAGGVFHGVYCAGNDETFAFLQDVLTEVFALFPGKYIHIGGDEVPKQDWKNCAKCQARIKAEGLKDENELQSYFIRRIEKFINANGRTLIGWSEIREGGLAKNAALMDWIGGAVEGAEEGHDVVMSPNNDCYLDHYQSSVQGRGVPLSEPRAIGGFLPLKNVYAYEPIPAKLPAEFQNHILGLQGNLWTEYIPTVRQMQYMIFPRECAIAEVGWSPKASRDWEGFTRRLQADERRLALLQVTCRPEPPAPPANSPPAYGPAPSPRQLAWEDLEVCGFLHFGMNTFTGNEWGYGDEKESTFNPADFDAGQIVRTAVAGGLKELVLVCKHHDGFCLWPSQYTEHSVKNSPWRNGHGDVVKEVSDACRQYGLRFGVYLSPWDRNHKDYGQPEYIVYYRNQLRELLGNYGPISEIWFDGANGGDGYYGGARERRTINANRYYDWTNTWQIVRELQPNACMFSDGGPDIRWVGNENGTAGVTCWATLNRRDFAPGQSDTGRLNRGDRPGADWLPAECDVSIRPGWFYHASEDRSVKTPQQLVNLYFASVGRGASLLLNLPPDRRGQIAGADARSLQEFHRIIDNIFSNNLALDAKITASSTRGNDAGFTAENVLRGLPGRYWAAEDGVTNAELVLQWPKAVTFSVVRLREYIPLGQRVETYSLDQWQGGAWVEFATGTSIGHCRLVRHEPVTTDKVRLRILNSPVCPALAEFGVFSEAQ